MFILREQESECKHVEPFRSWRKNPLRDVLLSIEGAVSIPIGCVQIGFVPYLDRLQCDVRILERL
jgi:hypothetical protein